MSKRPRKLSAAEEALWRVVAKTASALPGRAALDERDDGAGSEMEISTPPRPASRKLASPAVPRPIASPPKLTPIERRLFTRLGRGSAPIDSRLDLHGLTQHEAHSRLARFLSQSQARGDKIVLVITGKGRPGSGSATAEGGVLRRVVPHWLAAPDLRPLVVGFEEAHVTHGGSGALYIRIRRKRSPAQS